MHLPAQLSSKLQLLGFATLQLVIFGGINYLIFDKLQLCVWRSICGYPCPGCGLTHAGLFLLSGNIRESLQWNPFLIPIVLTLMITSIPSGMSRFADRFRSWKIWFALLLSTSSAYFVYRLIRFYPQDPEVGPMFYDPCNYCMRIYELFSSF